MSADDDKLADRLFKSLNDGLDWDEWIRVPSLNSYVQELEDLAFTKYPLLHFGLAGDDSFYLTEEERTHIHILGTPGQGKSKLLELLCRHDIDRLMADPDAPGFCLIDSSDFGNTFKKVLRYCRHVGFEKVCIIDPTDFNGDIGKVATLNVFGSKKRLPDGREVYRRPKSAVVAAVQNIFRVLWENEEFSRTSNINRSLELVTSVLYEALGTLYDAQYFRVKAHPDYEAKRAAILAYSDRHNISRVELEDLFFHQPPIIFDSRFGSTIGRLTPVFGGTLPMMLASADNTVNFAKLIGGGWIVLVNADPAGWDVPQRRLLGTIVISEIVNAMYSLVSQGYNKPFRLLVDEVGRYATESLAEVITHKRTSQIHLVAAHQQFSQIKNKDVASALASAPIKVSFYLERADRDQMFKQMYYGEMDRQASDEFHDLKKQHAIIKVGKKAPRKVRLRDLHDIPPDDKADLDFKTTLYNQAWYKSWKDINHEINARFPTGPQSAPTFRTTRRSKSQNPVEATRETGSSTQNSGSTQTGAVSDNRPSGADVLRRKTGRSTRKVDRRQTHKTP